VLNHIRGTLINGYMLCVNKALCWHTIEAETCRVKCVNAAQLRNLSHNSIAYEFYLLNCLHPDTLDNILEISVVLLPITISDF
jgi:hypothetical protein